MIKPRIISISPDFYLQDIQLCIIRGQKYFRIVKQFNENEDISEKNVSLFFKKLKRAKTLKALKLQAEPSSCPYIKPERIQSVLQVHSQTLQELDMTMISSISSKKKNDFLFPMKRLKKVCISNDISHIKSLSVHKKLENLLINMKNGYVKSKLLYGVFTKLSRLRSLGFVVFPGCLDKILQILNQFSGAFDRPVKFQILTKEENKKNKFPELGCSMRHKIVKLSMQNLNSDFMLQKLLSGKACCLTSLQILKLGFISPDIKLAPYLIHLHKIPLLKKISLYFVECWDTDFIEEVIKNLHLPVLLQDLKIAMPLSFKNLMQKYAYNSKKYIGNQQYPWRKNNFFEKEVLFSSFFKALEEATCLRKVKFAIQITEGFKSYYTNFFVSILNRLHYISSFALHATDCTLQDDFTSQLSEGFDLALIFEACSKIQNLEHIEVLMPNLLFADTEISNEMTNLKSFTVGVTENEEEGVFRFTGITEHITRWLKRIFRIAPNLSSLILDFTEVMDEIDFSKRFMLIERFIHLESFCSRFKVSECSSETAKKVGKIIQSLQGLKTIVLKFVESDGNLLEIRNYLNYHRFLREILVSYDEKNWIGKNDNLTSSDIEMQEGELDNLNASSDESLELQSNDDLTI